MIFTIPGGAFEGVEDQVSPFGYGRGEGVDAGHGDPEWICSKEKPRYDQLFQSLNPIDGKVTGAGTLTPYTRTLARALHTHPQLRAHLLVDRALEALMSTTHNCSLLSELCLSVKDRGDDSDASHFVKLVDSLSSATDNCKALTQLITNVRDAQVASAGPRLSPAVSIHSLNDTAALEGGASPHFRGYLDSYDTHSYTSHSDSRGKLNFDSRSHTEDPNTIDDTESNSSSEAGSESSAGGTPRPRLTCLQSLFDTVKLIVLLALNVVTLVIITELIFAWTVYSLTGTRYIEFYVERSPDGWLDKASLVAFGPQLQAVRIHSVLELFYRDNVISILKYLVGKLTSTVPT